MIYTIHVGNNRYLYAFIVIQKYFYNPLFGNLLSTRLFVKEMSFGDPLFNLATLADLLALAILMPH